MKDNFSVEGALCHFYSKLKKVVFPKMYQETLIL